MKMSWEALSGEHFSDKNSDHRRRRRTLRWEGLEPSSETIFGRQNVRISFGARIEGAYEVDRNFLPLVS